MSNTNNTNASVEAAVRGVLASNFDADSTVCLKTLLKVVDNLLQKPGVAKVRTLKLQNPAIRSKIVDKQGHSVLLACGFVHHPQSMGQEERLVLDEATEDTELLVRTRHTLARTLVRELGVKQDDIPAYRAPQPKPKATATPSSSFDIYQGRRFDGQSAALGTNLGAPDNWKSKTEQELARLQQREAKLQRQLQAGKNSAAKTKAAPTIDRDWQVSFPGQQQPPAPAVADTSSSSTTRGDSQLLASHFKQQHAHRQAMDNKGFTTKAMRDLEKLQKTKVYSHTQLAIRFPDGVCLKANFGTSEPVASVLESLASQVLRDDVELPPLELYQTPPKRVLEAKQTLKALGLVPAARIYAGWKSALPAGLGSVGGYLRAQWHHAPAAAQSTSPALPTSVPVVEAKKTSTVTGGSSSSKPPAKKKTKAEKEAALLKRMLGK